MCLLIMQMHRAVSDVAMAICGLAHCHNFLAVMFVLRGPLKNVITGF